MQYLSSNFSRVELENTLKAGAAQEMFSRLKKILKWTIGVLAFIVLLTWLGILIFFPDDKVLAMVLDKVRSQTGWQVTAKNLDLDVFSGFVIEDVELGPGRKFKEPAVRIDRVDLAYDLGAILHEHVRIKSARIQGVGIHVRKQDGQTNIDAMIASVKRKLARAESTRVAGAEDEGSAWSFDLQKIVVDGLSLHTEGMGDLTLDAQGVSLELNDGNFNDGILNLRARLHVPTSQKSRLELGPGGPSAALGADLIFALDSSHGMGVDGVLAARDFRLSSQSPAVDLEVHLGAKMKIDGSFLDIPSLDVFSQKTRILHAQGSLSVRDGALELDASSDGIELTAEVKKLLGLANLHGDLRLTDSHVHLPLDGVGTFVGSTKLQAQGLGFGTDSVNIGKVGIQAEASLEGKLGGRAELLVTGSVDSDDFLAGTIDGHGLKGSVKLKSEIHHKDQVWNITTHGATVDVSADRLKFSVGAGRGIQVHAGVDAQCKILAQGAIKCPRLQISGADSAERFATKGASLWGVRGKFGLDLVGMDTMRFAQLRAQHFSADAALTAGGFWSTKLSTGPVRAGLKVDGEKLDLGRFELPAIVQGHFASRDILYRDTPKDTKPKASMGTLSVDLRTRLRSAQDRNFPFSVRAQGSLLKIARGVGAEPWSVAGPMILEADGGLDVRFRKVQLAKGDLRIEHLMDLTVSGLLDLHKSWLDGKFATGQHSLANIRARLPSDIRRHVPEVWGQVKILGSVTGRLAVPTDYKHLPFSVDLAVLHDKLGFRVDPLDMEADNIHGPIRIKAGPAYGNQVQSTIQMHCEKIRLGKAKLRASGVDLVLAGTLEEDTLSADGSNTFHEIDLPGGWPKPLRDVRVDFSSRILGFKDVRLNEIKLAAPSVGLSMSGQGKVLMTQGTKDWSALRMALKTRTRFDSDSFVRFPGGLELKGRAEILLDLNTLAPGIISTRGGVKMNGFDLRSQMLSIVNARGMIPVSQRIETKPALRLLGGSNVSGRSLSTRSSAYDKALMPLKGSSRSFSVGALSFGGLEFAHLSGNFGLDSGRADLSDLHLKFLSGDVIAQTSIVLAPSENSGLWLDAQMSGVDLSALGSFQLEGRSDLSGNLRLSLDWNHRDLSSSFHLTSIGRSTLLALLSSLDPKETNQGLQEFRKFLHKYDVVVKESQLDIRHGLVSMIVRLDMSLLARAAAGFIHGYRKGAFYLPSVPVGNILSKYLEF